MGWIIWHGMPPLTIKQFKQHTMCSAKEEKNGTMQSCYLPNQIWYLVTYTIAFIVLALLDLHLFFLSIISSISQV